MQKFGIWILRSRVVQSYKGWPPAGIRFSRQFVRQMLGSRLQDVQNGVSEAEYTILGDLQLSRLELGSLELQNSEDPKFCFGIQTSVQNNAGSSVFVFMREPYGQS